MSVGKPPETNPTNPKNPPYYEHSHLHTPSHCRFDCHLPQRPQARPRRRLDRTPLPASRSRASLPEPRRPIQTRRKETPVKSLQEWLNRKPAGPKPKRRVKPVSKKRKKESVAYAKRRKAYLAAHPLCACSMSLFGYHQRADQIHHKAGRLGPNYLDESTWLAVCRESHEWIHAHASKARANGWIINPPKYHG